MGNIAKELRWMLSGSTNIRDLGCGIWDEWADENGDLGPVYGKRFKDQLPSFIDGIKNDPMSRRHIISTWDFYSLSEQRLPPCHGLVIQAYVAGDVISTLVYIRSWDLFLGAPYNIAFYALFTHLIANTTGLRPGGLVIQAGDVHIYKNHLEQVKEQLTRAPHTPPKLHCSQTIDEFIACPKYELIDYTHHPRIKGEVSV
jgi:thymidylate synthase